MTTEGEIPPGPMPPAGGNYAVVTWTVDLGQGLRVGQIGVILGDLQTAVDLGERIGARFTQEFVRFATTWMLATDDRFRESLMRRTTKTDNPSLLALVSWASDASREFRRTGQYPEPPERLNSDIDLLSIDVLPSYLGQPIHTVHVKYENPLEVILGGAGFLLAGTITVLRMVRDWSANRRRAVASADFAEWLVQEAREGRIRVPPGELLAMISPQDVTALSRLASSNPQLQLPPPTTDPESPA